MNVAFSDRQYPFHPWKPEMGKVFDGDFAFDCETTLIDGDRWWEVPPYVIGAAFDGSRGVFVQRNHASAFFAAHRDNPVIFHNAPFDLAVLHLLVQKDDQDVYERVDQNLIHDTQLLYRLYVLGTVGHTASGKGESTLETCTEQCLHVSLPKDVKDSRGKPVRLSYGQYLNRSPQDVEPVYLEYLAKDVIATFQLFEELQRRLTRLLHRGRATLGYVSQGWLNDQIDRWGLQTHHVQLRAAIVLREITANGLHLDKTRRHDLEEQLRAKQAALLEALRKEGWIPGKGSGKALQSIMKRLERENRNVHFPRTKTGKYSTSRDHLQDLTGSIPFVDLYLQYQAVSKLLSSFLTKMAKGVVHPSFNVLARTGRTTSFGEINAQNLPRDDSIRNCFLPSPGHVFIDADYSTIELVALAQACESQFDLDSRMAQAINAGKDLHRVVAAHVVGKPEESVTKQERSKAKPINFGKPGGMGSTTLQQYAKVSYGITLSDQEVEDLTTAWFRLFPEMSTFLESSVDVPRRLAQKLQLTPAAHCRHTESRRFVDHPDNRGRENQPHPILGGMCIKVLGHERPQSQSGKPYAEEDCDFLWTQAQCLLSGLPEQRQTELQACVPSRQLQRAITSLVSRADVFTLTGRLRANASWAAQHNTIFQGLAADGAKQALWLLWREGYRIVNFVHDEVLIEIPASASPGEHAKKIRTLMIEGMKQVIPDVSVDVGYAAMDRWYKSAEAVVDADGKLMLWKPATEDFPKDEDEPVTGTVQDDPGSTGVISPEAGCC